MTRDQVDALQFEPIGLMSRGEVKTTVSQAIGVPFRLLHYQWNGKTRFYCLDKKVIGTKEELYKALEEL